MRNFRGAIRGKVSMNSGRESNEGVEGWLTRSNESQSSSVLVSMSQCARPTERRLRTKLRVALKKLSSAKKYMISP